MSKITFLPQTASVGEMQRNYRRLLDRAKTSKSPVFVLRNNSPEAVIVDVESWNQLMKWVIKEEAKDALEAIKEYEVEKRAGKLKILKPEKLSRLLKK